MGFTEATFLFIFLPVSVILYLAAEKILRKDRVNNSLLVIFSAGFYLWTGSETFLFFVVTGLFVYLAGNAFSCESDEVRKKRAVLPVVLLTGILLFYKYAALIVSWVEELASEPVLSFGDIITPIGISYVVFEAVSYVVDICRKDAEPGTLLECYTFLSLFPKLVSGPIVLWKDFRPQLKNRRSSAEQIAAGIDRIIIGYAKKAILADTFGRQVALINNAVAAGTADVPTFWLRAVLYAFQLYFDFSGYSDIAIGLCGIFGFRIRENFRYPYLSRSVSEFWRRWHISLGTWFREYVYIPLGGNRRGNVYLHLAVVFLLTGLWHGTGWQFIAWGGVHGLLVVLERLARDRAWYRKIPGAARWFLTTLAVCLAWVLFMSDSVPSALESYAGMFSATATEAVNFTWQYYLSGRTLLFLVIAVAGQAAGAERIQAVIRPALDKPAGAAVKRILLLLLFAVDILYIVNSTYSPFLYFQF